PGLRSGTVNDATVSAVSRTGGKRPAWALGERMESRSIAFCAGIFLLSLLPLLVSPVLPTIDFYNHAARYFILTHLDESGSLQLSYAAAWNVLPNLGLD